jgi:CRISPR-associated endonuclease/helicase Cas3
MEFIAHTKNERGKRQDLLEHLRNVAEMAAQFATPFNAVDLARLAGLLHDIGKFDPEFQRYLLESEAGTRKRGTGPKHKGAGTVLAAQHHLDFLAFLVAGHHGGLPAASALRQEILPEWQKDPAMLEAIRTAEALMPEVKQGKIATIPAWLKEKSTTPFEVELFIRFLFSALVDADFLDTEAHYAKENAPDRDGYPSLTELWEWFQEDQQTKTGQKDDSVNVVRHEVYEACLAAADLPPGVFRLTVPTGGGKTRSSLAFALKHAMQHHLSHVIYSIPYMSITEQTADVFREIFARDPRAVLEHHSGVIAQDPDNPTMEEQWARLASENWDAPLVVTTTVQLFQSLLANGTSPCRKLHAIANSVIILDEAQTLPPGILAPTLDVMRQLVERYHVTIVLCTATQPALDTREQFAGLKDIREIIPDPAAHFQRLQRVTYTIPAKGETWSWDAVAEYMSQSTQALAIVNTRKDAATLHTTLDDPWALHLSTLMCGSHRRAVLAEAKRRLLANEPCLLVATQLIEAGVNVDFPLVLRAMGPLDSIVQAAGRCNREGKMTQLGQVVVFDPEEGHLPPGAYSIGAQLAQSILAERGGDLADPAIFTTYFQEWYKQIPHDEKQVQEARKSLDYPEVAKRYHLIDDATQSVVVLYAEECEHIEALLARLGREHGRGRALLRQLQPYIVGLRQYEIDWAKDKGVIEESSSVEGVWIWRGTYDPQRGIVFDGMRDPETMLW